MWRLLARLLRRPAIRKDLLTSYFLCIPDSSLCAGLWASSSFNDDCVHWLSNIQGRSSCIISISVSSVQTSSNVDLLFWLLFDYYFAHGRVEPLPGTCTVPSFQFQLKHINKTGKQSLKMYSNWRILMTSGPCSLTTLFKHMHGTFKLIRCLV